MKAYPAAALLCCCALSVATARAGPPPPTVDPPGRWTLGAESMYLFNTIPNPFFLLVDITGEKNRKNVYDYHLFTQVVGARYQLSDTGGWRFLRGNWQLALQGIYSHILKGPEDYFGGILVGFRYNFVPAGGAWFPFVEFRGSCGFTDASGLPGAEQQDFAFGYLLSTGVRYDVDARWQISLSVLDQHLSSLYLSDENYGFDSSGVNLGVDWRF